MIHTLILLLCVISSKPLLYSIENQNLFDHSKEFPCLQNIRQLTSPSMGFEKAGEAYFSPDSNMIAFQAVPEGKEHYQIYTLQIGSETPVMVSTGKGACTCANFHPNGTKLIFASSHEDQLHDDSSIEIQGYQRQGGNYAWHFTPYMNIYEANIDGSDLKPLTKGPDYTAECAYSQDGNKIVFASNRSGSMNLYTMDADGSNVLQVTHTSTGYNGGPFLSPDGTKIIFRADYQEEDYLQIYCIDSDGHNLRQLTDNGAVNWAPYWHPSGKFIAFTTSLHGHAHYEIYLLNIETGLTRRITHNATFDGLPVFNRDGTKLLWTSKRGSDGTSQIFIADFYLNE